MNLDNNHLTTVQATVEKTSSGKHVINLLRPFLSGPVMARSQVSHVKLLSGSEGGISLSIDGNQLAIDLEYYGYLSPGDSEELYYEYRINQPDRPYSKHTAMMTIMATDEHDPPILHEAILTTDQPFDHSACEESLGQQALAEITEDEQIEAVEAEAVDLESESTSSKAPSESQPQREENTKKFSFSNTNPADYEPSQQNPDDHNEKTRVDRSKDIDQAIAEADQLLEATLGIQQEEDTPAFAEDDSSPEQALERLINQIPDEQALFQKNEPEPKAETELEHIIDGLATITDESPDASPNSAATGKKTTYIAPHQKYEAFLTSLDTYIFNLEDFNKQADKPVDKLKNIKLNTLPSAGRILYNRVSAQAGQEISRIDLLTGRLIFKPDEHFADRGNAQFFFSPCYSAEYSPRQLFKLSYLEAGETPTSNEEEISRNVSMEIDITADNGASVLASGNMIIKGKDSTHLAIIAGTVAGSYGTFTVNSNGYWTYSLDKNQPAIFDLRENNCLSEHLVITTEEGSKHGVLLTIICRNQQVDILVSQGDP